MGSQDGHAPLIEVTVQKRFHQSNSGSIQRGEWLIQNPDQAPREHQGRKGCALALTLGKLTYTKVHPIGKSDLIQRRGEGGRIQTLPPKGGHHAKILLDTEILLKPQKMSEKTEDGVETQGSCVNIDARPLHPPLIGPGKACKNSEQAGLSRAIGAFDSKGLARTDTKIQMLEQGDLSPVTGKIHSFKHQRGHRRVDAGSIMESHWHHYPRNSASEALELRRVGPALCAKMRGSFIH